MNKIQILGIGPGDEDYLLPIAKKRAEEADVLVGGQRALDLLAQPGQETKLIKGSLSIIVNYIREMMGKDKKVAVLLSGDPGLYGMLSFLRKNFSEDELEVIPGISAMQMCFARLRLPWQDIKIVSLHGRTKENLLSWVKEYPKLAFFTDAKLTPSEIGGYLLENGVRNMRAVIAENLSYPNERVLDTDLAGLKNELEMKNAVMLLYKEDEDKVWPYSTPGIPDELFIRGEVPMTKEEVRAVTIAKLRLKEDSIVYDLGAGTGSISIEAALIAYRGQTVAIERHQKGVDLIDQNKEKFGAYNLKAINGEASAVLAGLPKADRIIIGGSGGHLTDMLDLADKKLNPGGRIVINCIVLETLQTSMEHLAKLNFQNIELVQVAVARAEKVGKMHMMKGLNPIFIVAADKI